MIEVVLADDHDLVRDGLKRILESQGDIKVTGETARGEEVLSLIEKTRPQVVLLDISLPDRDGLEVLRLLNGRDAVPPVLIVTMYPEKEYALQAFQLGAKGYIRKDSPPAELISALRRVASGRRYITSSLADQLAGTLKKDSGKAPHEGLSLREKQVFLALCRGKTAGDIGSELKISENTVRTYRSRIMKKLNCHSTLELASYARRYQLI